MRATTLSMVILLLASAAACRQSKHEQKPPTPPPWQLPIAARQQWTNDQGYCGEASVQAIGLYYGVWLSQDIVRQAGGGEFLVGKNSADALGNLKLAYEDWDHRAQPLPQFENFMIWQKEHIAKHVPVIFTTYLHGENDTAYDHIVTALGLAPHNTDPKVYDGRDVLLYDDHYATQPWQRPLNTLAATRAGCQEDLAHGGCVPSEVDYGTAVLGVLDADHATLPVSLLVDSSEEANISVGQESREMRTVVTVRDLAVGRRYALLRYDDSDLVPTQGDAAAFLAAPHSDRVDFTATAAQWTYADPTLMDSSGVRYYRCVPLP